MSDINLTLKHVDAHQAIYQVRIEGSEAVSEFIIKSDNFTNLFNTEHFRIGVHRAVDYLKQFDPAYHQEQINGIFE